VAIGCSYQADRKNQLGKVGGNRYSSLIDNATENDMNAAATKEMAQILVVTSLESTAKKCGLTVRQVLDAIQADAESGEFSQITRTFMQYRTAGEEFIKSGKAQEFLQLAAA
jgi:hypothetical protein